LSQPVWPPAPRQQHQSVRARPNRALGVAYGGDIRKYQRAGIVQRPEHRFGRPDRSNDHLRPVPEQHLQIVFQARVGTVHDQIRTDRRSRAAVRVGMALQPFVDL